MRLAIRDSVTRGLVSSRVLGVGGSTLSALHKSGGTDNINVDDAVGSATDSITVRGSDAGGT